MAIGYIKKNTWKTSLNYRVFLITNYKIESKLFPIRGQNFTDCQGYTTDFQGYLFYQNWIALSKKRQ